MPLSDVVLQRPKIIPNCVTFGFRLAVAEHTEWLAAVLSSSGVHAGMSNSRVTSPPLHFEIFGLAFFSPPFQLVAQWFSLKPIDISIKQ